MNDSYLLYQLELLNIMTEKPLAFLKQVKKYFAFALRNKNTESEACFLLFEMFKLQKTRSFSRTHGMRWVVCI